MFFEWLKSVTSVKLGISSSAVVKGEEVAYLHILILSILTTHLGKGLMCVCSVRKLMAN
jgi:hypothetical protein